MAQFGIKSLLIGLVDDKQGALWRRVRRCWFPLLIQTTGTRSMAARR